MHRLWQTLLHAFWPVESPEEMRRHAPRDRPTAYDETVVSVRLELRARSCRNVDHAPSRKWVRQTTLILTRHLCYAGVQLTPVPCPHCGREFTNLGARTVHVRTCAAVTTSPEDPELAPCPWCAKTFFRPGSNVKWWCDRHTQRTATQPLTLSRSRPNPPLCLKHVRIEIDFCNS